MKLAKVMLLPFVLFVLFNLLAFGPGGSIPIQHDWSKDELPTLETIVSSAKALPSGRKNIRALRDVVGKAILPLNGYGVMILSKRPGLQSEVINIDEEEIRISIRGSYIYGNGCESYFSHGLYKGSENKMWSRASIELRLTNGKSSIYSQGSPESNLLGHYLQSCLSADEIIATFPIS